MKIDKIKIMFGVVLLSLGIILAIPVIADNEDEPQHMPELYYFDEEKGEYMPWYPRWYNTENPDSFSPRDECPWWDQDGDGEFDWMPHWGRKWNNPESNEGYGYHGGSCGGIRHGSSNGYNPK